MRCTFHVHRTLISYLAFAWIFLIFSSDLPESTSPLSAITRFHLHRFVTPSTLVRRVQTVSRIFAEPWVLPIVAWKPGQVLLPRIHSNLMEFLYRSLGIGPRVGSYMASRYFRRERRDLSFCQKNVSRDVGAMSRNILVDRCTRGIWESLQFLRYVCKAVQHGARCAMHGGHLTVNTLGYR